MQLGNNIQTLRKRKGLSQEKLAEKINVTRQTISNWELGETAPNPEQLILLSKQFDISIDVLVGNDAMPSGSSRENKSIKRYLYRIDRFVRHRSMRMGIFGKQISLCGNTGNHHCRGGDRIMPGQSYPWNFDVFAK